jgi:hypothetical protein
VDEDFEQELYETDIFEDMDLAELEAEYGDDDPNPYEGTYSEE